MLREYSEDQKINLAFVGACLKGVAHNINTPLAAVMGRAEMLQMRLAKLQAAGAPALTREDIERCIKDATLILENSVRVSSIVKNAMKKSMTVESSESQPIRIEQLLKDELDFLNSDMFFKHSVLKQYEIQEDLPPLRGTAVDFSTSFLEIIDNSLRAMKDTLEKRLTVTAALDGKMIRIAIHDTGCGIEPELQKQLLELLHSGRTTPQHSEQGLQRVARLLAPYCARFELVSEPGSTTVTVLLPVTPV